MSLETLLEAAEFIDCERDNEGGTRAGKGATDFHPYAKTLPKYKYNPRARTQSQNSNQTDDESSSGKQLVIGSTLGNRSLHNRLEKNRRAQLKTCFENLKDVLPTLEDRKASNLFILKSAVRQIQTLRRQETELEMEMQKVAREKIMNQQRIATLLQEVNALNIKVDLTNFIQEDDVHSTSTATADGDEPILSDDDGQSSSTLSTTSTPNTSAFGHFTQSPLKSPKSESLTPLPSPITVVSLQQNYLPPVGQYMQSSPQMSHNPESVQIQPQVTATSSMQSILNRTLLAATTTVLTSLTGSQMSTTTVAKSANTALQMSAHGRPLPSPHNDHVPKKAEVPSKLSVNQILQQTLLQRNLQQHQQLQQQHLQQHQLQQQQLLLQQQIQQQQQVANKSQEALQSPRPVLLATKVQSANDPTAAQIDVAAQQQQQLLGNGPLLLGNMDQLLSAAAGKSAGKLSVSTLLNPSGPATIAKLVSQKEANCDVQSGVQLSSLTSAHLSITLPSSVVTATSSRIPASPMVTSIPTPNPNPPRQQQQQASVSEASGSRNVMTFAELLPSLYTSQAAGNTAASVAMTTTPPQATANPLQPQQVASITNLGNIALATASGVGSQGFQLQQQPQQQPQVVAMNQPLIAPVQTITQTQLHQLLQASLVQQQLNLQLQQQQQKLVSLATTISVASASVSSAATTVSAPMNNSANQMATNMAANSISSSAAPTMAVAAAIPNNHNNNTSVTSQAAVTSTNLAQPFNLSALPLSSLISPISIVTPNVQLTGINQVLNTQLGQFPTTLLQQPTLMVLPTTAAKGPTVTDIVDNTAKPQP